MGILKAVLDDMKPLRPDAILLIVANPVDILTFFAQHMSGLPRRQVIGTGTFLDTARLRIFLAEETQASQHPAGVTHDSDLLGSKWLMVSNRLQTNRFMRMFLGNMVTHNL
jgi:malate/lactate dehydrogenase